MFDKTINKKRKMRKIRVRAKINGTSVRPRLSIHKSNKNIELQLIDDANMNTIASVSSYSNKLNINGAKAEIAKRLAKEISNKAKNKNISQFVLDRGWYKFHGIIKIIADEIKNNGIKI